jgi:Spy/CpxP family protein refolding chaperone
MENNRFLKIVIIALLLINIGVLSYVWMGAHNGPSGDGHRQGPDVFGYLCKELQLDDEQTKQYAALRDEHHQAMQAIQHKSHQLRDRFFDMLHVSPVDSAAIKSMSDSIAHTQEQIELVTFYHFQKVRAILRPDQQKHFDSIIQETLSMMAPGHDSPPALKP